MRAMTSRCRRGGSWRRTGSAALALLMVLNLVPACGTGTEGRVPILPRQLPEQTPPGAFPLQLPPVAAPAEPPPAPTEEYRLGVGDVLEISLFRPDIRESDDLRRQMPVRPDGKISYFFVGDVQASGRTTEELRREITQGLSRYIRSPEVAVLLIESLTKVYVVGQVVEQGARILKPPYNSVLDAIFLSKGLTPQADVDRAYVIRSNALINVQLGDLMLRGDRSKNVLLQPGDVVYVPEVVEQRVFVVGYFKRPGAFPVSRPIRVSEAIALAEDFSLGAKKDAVKIVRGGLPKGQEPPEIVTVDVEALREGTAQDVYVQRGDIVLASPTLLGKWNEILMQLLPSFQAIFYPVAGYGIFTR